LHTTTFVDRPHHLTGIVKDIAIGIEKTFIQQKWSLANGKKC